MTTVADRSWVARTDIALAPDPTRVVARLFLPGQEPGVVGHSRAATVLERIMALDDEQVTTQLDGLRRSFSGRHRDLEGLWATNLDLVRHRFDDADVVSEERAQLAGAYFTLEYAVEGAALTNPSMVAHPDQSGLPSGSTRFILTLRAIGEGHLSSVELRSGVVDATGAIELGDVSPFAEVPAEVETTWSRTAFAHQLGDMWGDHSESDFVLGLLPERFGRVELDEALNILRDQERTRAELSRTLERFDWVAACSYTVEFDADVDLSARLLMPRAPAESHGIEDVRLVQFEGHELGYLGTYTSYDGGRVSSQLIATDDFTRFAMRRMSGPGSLNKGLALFPRRIDGRFVALSRSDRESNGITWSDDLQHWGQAPVAQSPAQPWEIVQMGNCGSPIETDDGWLVLTHGVGPMREYCIGATLLDLHDPTVVLASLAQPLLRPTVDERSGYVPNVVYSCGAMRHGRSLVLPYGCSDRATRIAVVQLDPLLDALRASRTGTTRGARL